MSRRQAPCGVSESPPSPADLALDEPRKRPWNWLPPHPRCREKGCSYDGTAICPYCLCDGVGQQYSADQHRQRIQERDARQQEMAARSELHIPSADVSNVVPLHPRTQTASGSHPEAA